MSETPEWMKEANEQMKREVLHGTTPAPDAVTLPEGVAYAFLRYGDAAIAYGENPLQFGECLDEAREDLRAEIAAALEDRYDAGYRCAIALGRKSRERHEARVRELEAALEGLMQFESRGRLVPVGEEWNKARAALSQTCVIHQWGAFVIRHETPCIACGITYGEYRAARQAGGEDA